MLQPRAHDDNWWPLRQMENTHQSDLQSKEAERQQHQRSLEQEYHRGKEAGTFCAAAPCSACLWSLESVCFPPCLVRPGRRLPVQGLSDLLQWDKGRVCPLSRVMCCAASQRTSCMRTIALGVLLWRLLGLAASTEFPDACFAGQNDERARNAAAKAGCCYSDLALLLPRASTM